MTLRQELGISGPNPSVYALARRMRHGEFPVQTDGPDVSRKSVPLAQLKEELSAISANVVAGLNGGVDYNNLLYPQSIEGQEYPNVVPVDFSQFKGRERALFGSVASAMSTTYSVVIFSRLDEMRQDETQLTVLKRTDRLFGIPENEQNYTPGDALEAFLIENSAEAANLQSAFLRIIPALVKRAKLSGDIQTYQQIATNTEQFIRDFSLVPSAISQFVGEELFGKDQPGLWDSILLAGNPEVFLDYFSLIPSKTGDGVRIDFSEAFKKILKEKADKLKETIDPSTGLPMLTEDSWFGCPGIHKINGVQLNIEMWRQHVALAPQLYELVA